MIKTYTYKLYHTKKQRKLDYLVGLANEVYNHAIALHKRYYRLYGSYINKSKLQKHIAKVKNRSYPHWKLLGSQAEQNVIERIDFGYTKFFRKENKRPPKFRAYRKAKSFMFKGSVGYSVEGNTLRINAIKTSFKFHKSRAYQGRIKTMTIKRDALGDYYIFFSCQIDNFKPIVVDSTTDKIAGFDFGLKDFIVTSENQRIDNPEYLKSSLKVLRGRSRKHSKKQKGSNNRKKSRISLARLHKKISNQRNNFQWNEARKLVSKYDVLCFEDLNMRGMQRLWGRKVSDYSFADFLKKVEWIAFKEGKKIVKIDRFYPSSKTCHICLEKHESLKLSDRQWRCNNCGTVHDRDLNAAINIKMVGTSTINGEARRPSVRRQVSFVH